MTERRTFLIAVDASDPNSDPSVFRKALKDNPAVSAWWNHLPFVYLVTSELDAARLTASIYDRAPLGRFLVMRVTPDESEGLLPEKAWDWIRKRSTGVAETNRAKA